MTSHSYTTTGYGLDEEQQQKGWLSRNFRKVAAIGGVTLALAGAGVGVGLFVTNLPPTYTLGPGATSQALHGHEAAGTLARSGDSTERFTIDGSALKAGTRYAFNNVSVTIDGNVPDNTTITGNNGQLIVTGNAGNGSTFTANVPEYQRFVPDTCTGIRQQYVGETANNTPEYISVPYTYDCSYYVDTGAKPPFNKDPAIVIEGKAGKNVTTNGSLGIKVAHRP